MRQHNLGMVGGSSGSSSRSSSRSESRSGSRSGSSSSGAEPTTILGHQFHLPRDLCDNADIFREFMSARTWDALSEADCHHLRRFLPSFPEDDAQEKDVTLRRLFARDTFRFGSPLVQFQKRLAAGAFRQDGAARLRAGLAAARRRRAKRRRRRRWRRELQPVLAARERLLTLAHALPPSHTLPPSVVRPSTRSQIGPAARARAHRRYFQELAAIHYEVYGESGGMSDDDNYPEGPPPPLSKQHRNYLNQLQSGNTTVFSTLGQGYHIMSGMTSFTDEWKRNALLIHRRRRLQQPSNCELNTRGITLSSIRSRVGDSFLKDDNKCVSSNGKQAQMAHNNRRLLNISRKAPSPSDSGSEEETNQFKMTSTAISTPIPVPKPNMIALSNSIPVTNPIVSKIENTTQDNVEADDEVGLQLVQATHACFLSVIRDLVCNTARHCLPLVTLEARLRNWRQNPIAPLNHWYSSVEDWLKALPSAISFLTGESSSLPDEFVPYLQYKPTTQVYQWIGAGRDSDSLLMPLCAHWLSHRQAVLCPAVVPTTTAPITAPSPAAPLEIVEGVGIQLKGWNNRYQLTPEELESFRTQEAARFQRPHRSFTYHMTRNKIVVGPLKGVYGCDEPGSNNSRGARGHTLLTATRPRHVTLLALVRDAVACLPGGEGTRAHITTILRRSQYLVPDAGEQALQAAVSGALDRMHGSHDPCVQYIPARKLWVYLHTNRTEEDFERLHAETQKNKTLASIHQKRNVTSTKAKPVRPVKPPIKHTNSNEVVNTTGSLDDDCNSEDVHVDVESTEVSTLGLSMQTPSPILPASPAPMPLHTEKVIPSASVMSGTSLLQPRAPILASTMLKRNVNTVQVSSPRSVVRVLSSTTTSGKSLISPQALQSTTPTPDSNIRPVISQAKLVVQKPTGQTTGSLTPAQQRRLLESLMRHQRQHGQPMTHDQLLHTINSTQKMSSSPPTSTTQMSVVVSKPATSANQTVQLTGQTVQLPSGQTVQLTGQTVQLTSQTVQLTGQTVQLGGQTVQIGGQTVQLAGQSVQLVEQNRSVGDSVVRPSTQRSTPLMAKILTSAQLRNSGNINIGNTTTGIRLSGLSLAQLQGKQLLLQNTSSTKSSNILLQTTGNLSNTNAVAIAGNAERLASPRQVTPTTQHTLLLSNLGGQVVRVAGSGAILGSTLRLQTPANTVQGSSGVILGGHALKLQGSPIRLHQAVGNASSSGRVLLTSGTRLHSLKLLPVHHSIAKGGTVGGRQVYARIVNPATANVVAGNTPAPTGSLVVGVKAPTPASTESPVIPAQNSQPPNR